MGASCYYPFYHINNHKYGGRKFDKRLDWLARPYIERVSILDAFHFRVVKDGTRLIVSSFPHAEPRQRLSTTSWCRIIIQLWTKKPYEIKSLRRISLTVCVLYKEGWRLWPACGYVLPSVGCSAMGEDMPPWPCSEAWNNLFIAYRTGFAHVDAMEMCFIFCHFNRFSLNCSLTRCETYWFHLHLCLKALRLWS